jgi:hypothetical protein
MKEFEQLASVHSEITAHLCKRASEDQACEVWLMAFCYESEMLIFFYFRAPGN